MKRSEVFSPVSLVRLLLEVNKKNPLNVIQLKDGSFFDFHEQAKVVGFKQVPFSKVKQLVYNKTSPPSLLYRCSFEETFTCVTLSEFTSHHVTCLSYKPKFSVEKVKDFQEMLKFMPSVDAAYFRSLMPSVNVKKSGLGQVSSDSKGVQPETSLRPAMKGKKSGQQQPSNSTELSHETRLKQAIKVRKSALGQCDSKGVPLKQAINVRKSALRHSSDSKKGPIETSLRPVMKAQKSGQQQSLTSEEIPPEARLRPRIKMKNSGHEPHLISRKLNTKLDKGKKSK